MFSWWKVSFLQHFSSRDAGNPSPAIASEFPITAPAIPTANLELLPTITTFESPVNIPEKPSPDLKPAPSPAISPATPATALEPPITPSPTTTPQIRISMLSVPDSPVTTAERSVSAAVSKRLRKEAQEKDPPLHISSGLVAAADVLRWPAIIIGPAGCPFENGVFTVSVSLSNKYPFKPPEIKFETKIFHPNIDEEGEISIDILGPEWTPALTVNKTLLAICSILSDPVEPFDTHNPVGKLYQENWTAYEKTAREWTVKYAMNG